MDSKKHFSKRLFTVLFLASSCTLVCLLAGCEEELLTNSDKSIETTEFDTRDTGLEGIAQAAKEARESLDEKFTITSPEMASNEPYVVPEEEIAEAVAEITRKEPAANPEIIPAEAPVEKPVAFAALETVVIEPENTEDAVIADNFEEEAIKAEEKEAIAILAQDIGLKIPTPAENTELLKETKISVPSLDNMHIANAPLVSDNGDSDLEDPGDNTQEVVETEDTEAVTEVQTDQPVEDEESKGFFRKMGSTVGNAVSRFTAKQYFILGGAVVFVAALIYLRNKKMLSLTPWRKKR